MRFSPDFIEQVRESNNIVDVINHHTQLKGSGNGRHVGLCPFPDHNERSPSFSVSEVQQLYHCFGCKKSGNIFHFVQAFQGLSFPESVEYLAHKAGISLPKDAQPSPEQAKAHDKRKTAWRVNKLASQFFHNKLLNLPATHPAKIYCQKRGLRDDIIKEFQLGYAPDSWSDFLDYLKQSNAPIDVALELGLLRQKNKGNGNYDGYRDRLMFPIISHKERTIGFGGRILSDGNPKYINSPESLVFHKSKTLYGLNISGKYIRSNDHIILVEGYMDYLALYSVGIKNVAATLGTALTPQHASLIKNYTKNITLLFDGDSAGQKASERSLPILLSEGLMPKTCLLKEGLDPDDYIQKYGLEAMKEALKASPDLFIHLLNQYLVDYRGQASEKVSLMSKLAPLLKQTNEPLLKSLYMMEVCDRLQVSPQWVKNSLRNGKSSSQTEAYRQAPQKEELTETAPQAVSTAGDSPISLEAVPREELFLVNLAFINKDCLDSILESQIHKQFSHQGAAEVIERTELIYRQTPNKFDNLVALLLSQVAPKKALSLHLEPQLAELDQEGLEKMRRDCSRKVREKHMRSKTKELSSHLKNGSPEEQLKKLEQIMNIQKNRRDLNKNIEPK